MVLFSFFFLSEGIAHLSRVCPISARCRQGKASVLCSRLTAVEFAYKVILLFVLLGIQSYKLISFML